MFSPWQFGQFFPAAHLQDLFQHLFKPQAGQKTENGLSRLELRPGQIIEGKVLKIMPDQRAWIRLGDKFKVLAQVNVPLTAGQLEWFQVEKVSGPVILKVITPPATERHEPAPPSNHWQTLLRWLGAAETEENIGLIKRIVDLQLPINRSLFHQIEQTLAVVGRGEREEEAILWAIQKGWPPTPSVIRSLITFWHGPDLPQLLTDLGDHLPPAYKASWQSIVERLPIAQILPHNIKQYLQQLFFPPLKTNNFNINSNLNALNHFNHPETINRGNATDGGLPKPASPQPLNLPVLIQTLLQDPALNPAAKKLAEQVFAYLAGQEIVFKGENLNNPVAYLFFQLMVRQEKEAYTFFGHLEGQRNGKGKVSKEHCRLLLYAQLKHLKETCLDVLVHQKWISIKLFNNTVEPSWVEEYRPILEEGLASLGYQLSSLSVKKWEMVAEPLHQKKGQPLKVIKPYQGVDIRI